MKQMENGDQLSDVGKFPALQKVQTDVLLNASYFTPLFNKITGLTPDRYRQLHGAKLGMEAQIGAYHRPLPSRHRKGRWLTGYREGLDIKTKILKIESKAAEMDRGALLHV